MMICNHCGQDIPETASRFGLSAQLSPPKVQYGGRDLIGLTPMGKRILFRLCKQGRASFESLAHRDGKESAGSHAVKVHICQLRDALADNGVLVTIVAISGWGYIMQPCSPEQLARHRASRASKRPSAPVPENLRNKGLRVNGRNAELLAGIFNQLELEGGRP